MKISTENKHKSKISGIRIDSLFGESRFNYQMISDRLSDDVNQERNPDHMIFVKGKHYISDL